MQLKVEQNPLSSSELGALWLTYQEKTLIQRVLEYFIEKSDDQQALNIMGGLWQELDLYVLKMEQILEDEGVAIPKGFTKEDVNLTAPKLYNNGFDIMFLRVLKELSMGVYTININMAYREDIISLYEALTSVTQRVYRLSTLYLLKKGILSLPPKLTMPNTTAFIKDKSYLSGFHLFNENRSLNVMELGTLHHGIETNIIGMQLITGFAQCANTKEIQQYFVKGKELAKKQINIFEKIFHDSDIQFSSASGGTVTTSTIAPFSEKLMMFCIYLLNGFGIVGSSFGALFSLRNDLSVKQAIISKDVYFYANEGVKLMIKYGWMEEPPQMEDRTNILKS